MGIIKDSIMFILGIGAGTFLLTVGTGGGIAVGYYVLKTIYNLFQKIINKKDSE